MARLGGCLSALPMSTTEAFPLLGGWDSLALPPPRHPLRGRLPPLPPPALSSLASKKQRSGFSQACWRGGMPLSAVL